MQVHLQMIEVDVMIIGSHGSKDPNAKRSLGHIVRMNYTDSYCRR